MLRELRHYARMAHGLAHLVRTPPLANPEQVIRQAVERREETFLDTARRSIFDSPAGPWRKMLDWAGCSHSDLEALVRSRGLESALAELQRAGVYLTHDEFKGKEPVLRNGLEMRVEPPDFANASAQGVFETSSSGSRSRGVAVRRNLEFLLHREALEFVASREFEGDRRVPVGLHPMLPATSGVRRHLECARYGAPPGAWFTLGGASDSRHYRTLTRAFMAQLRLMGARVPMPHFLEGDDFTAAAAWIAGQKSRGRMCVVRGGASRCVRTADAAREHGLDIAGTIFISGSEALTESKRAVIEQCGAEVYSRYAISEIGTAGYSCREMKFGNCVHVCLDTVAVISRRRTPHLTGVEVDSLLFTTLLPFAPLVLLNVEMDDAGSIVTEPCACSLTRCGYTQKIRGIYSYGKLTGQGTTLLGIDIVHILEHVLPERFGGAPGDYQLVEYDPGVQSEIELRVHPRLAISDTTAMSRVFLEEVQKLWGGALTRREWTQTKGLRVVIAQPYATRTGKILSLHLLGNNEHVA